MERAMWLRVGGILWLVAHLSLVVVSVATTETYLLHCRERFNFGLADIAGATSNCTDMVASQGVSSIQAVLSSPVQAAIRSGCRTGAATCDSIDKGMGPLAYFGLDHRARGGWP